MNQRQLNQVDYHLVYFLLKKHNEITSGDGLGVPEKKPFGFGMSTLTVASNVVSILHTAKAFKGKKIKIERKINFFMLNLIFKIIIS